LQVAGDLYSVHARSTDGGFAFGRTVADCRAGDVSGLRVPLGKVQGVLSTEPPDATRIQIGAAGEDGVALVSGAPGAVPPTSALLVVNLDTGQLNTGVSSGDGSFALPLFAPAGSFVLVKQDPTGRFLGNLDTTAGTIVYAAPPAGTFAATAAVGAD